jgi:Tol biopolymer transport system component
MNTDGSGVTKLTVGGQNGDAEYSPNGQLIVFLGTSPSPGVYVMNRDGTGRRALVTDPCFNFGESGAHFSPDGQRITFPACFGNPRRDVYTIRLDGTGLTRLTNTPDIDEYVRSWR